VKANGPPSLMIAVGKAPRRSDSMNGRDDMSDDDSSDDTEDGAERDAFTAMVEAIKDEDYDAAFDAFVTAVRLCVAREHEGSEKGGY
jgi:hypothetical protein